MRIPSDLVEGDGPVEDLDPEEGDEDVGDHEVIVLPGRLIRSSSNDLIIPILTDDLLELPGGGGGGGGG